MSRIRRLPIPAAGLAALLAVGGALAGCAAPTAPPASDLAAVAEPSWEAHVQPLLAARCATCHGAEAPAAGLDLTSWEGLTAGSDYGQALVAYDPERSLMLELAERLPEALPTGYSWRHATPYDVFRQQHRLPAEELQALRRWIAQGARNEAGEVPYSNPDGRVFVALQDAGHVSILDVDRHVVARNVALEAYGGAAATPHDTDYEPDGSAWYVTLIGAQRVLKFDAATNEVLAELDVRPINPTYKPGMLALDVHSDRLYLSRSISDLSGGRSIMAIERSDMSAEEILVPYTRPHPIGLAGEGRFILSGSLSDNIAATIDAETFDFSRPLRVDETQTPLLQYDVSPDGRTAIITGQFSDRVYVLDVADPENISVRGFVEVGREPWYPAFSPDGRRAFIPNHRSNTVSVIDVEALEEIAVISDPRFAMPHGAVASHDGRYLFISNSNLTHAQEEIGQTTQQEGYAARPITYQPRYPLDRSGDGTADNLETGHVAVIDAQTYEVLRIIELEAFPSGMSLWQRGHAHR